MMCGLDDLMVVLTDIVEFFSLFYLSFFCILFVYFSAFVLLLHIFNNLKF